MRIALIFHKNDRDLNLERYYVTHLSRLWAEDGHETEFVFGPHDYVPADIAFLHVNLSVVPPAYIDLAAKYPRAVNGTIADIRKRTISTNVVSPDSDWDGEIIVKSNYNYAGRPELDLAGGILSGRWRRRIRRFRNKLGDRFIPGSQADYRVYDRISAVPRPFFYDERLVVERFRPERDGDLYVVHTFHFLGNRITGTRIRSRDRIVTQENIADSEREDVHPDMVRLRAELGFEYGKFDYVVGSEGAVLLDANKTTGSAPTSDPRKLERRRFLAEGLYDYFP